MKAIVLALSLASAGLCAQTLKDIKLDIAQVQVGQNVTASIGLDVPDKANCGLRVRWGDGAVTEIRVEDKNAIPYQATHAYAKPGDYSVTADPGKVKSSLACVGKKVAAMVKVAAPPPPVAAATTTKAVAGPSCPEGWKLDAKSVVKKTGAYSCSAKAGTATPDKRPACPGDLTYFENGKKGVLGCKP